jgi:hypothetical protein
MLDSESIPNWAYEMLRRIERSSYAGIELLVMNGTPAPKARNFWQKLRDHRADLFYLAYTKLDNRLFKQDPDAFAEKDIRGLLPGVPAVTVVPRQTRFSDSFSQEDVQRVAEFDLDVLVRLGFRILRGGILQGARAGVWSFHHGDNRKIRGGPAGFWEVFLGWPETGSILQILSEDLDGGQVLYRSYSRTDSLSVSRNLQNFYWKTLSFLPRKLQQLHELGCEPFLAKVREENNEPGFYSNRLFVAPGNWEFAKLGLRHLGRCLVIKFNWHFYLDQWCLVYASSASGAVSSSAWRFKELTPPMDRFWADPFLVQRDGKYFIFLEELIYSGGKGHISYITQDESASGRNR